MLEMVFSLLGFGVYYVGISEGFLLYVVTQRLHT